MIKIYKGNYTIRTEGAIKYIYKNGEKITGGHHSFETAPDGSIIGVLGACKELIMTPDGKNIKERGFDEIIEMKKRKECAVLDYLNNMI